MSDESEKPAAKTTPKDARARRLAEELRANLQRRKQQSRARRMGAADETDGLPAAETGDAKPRQTD